MAFRPVTPAGQSLVVDSRGRHVPVVRDAGGTELLAVSDQIGGSYYFPLNGGLGRRQGAYGYRRGGVQGGGGMGGPADKSQDNVFYPTILNNRYFLDTIYAESWAAKKFINIPVDDMFIRPRRHVGDDDGAWERFDEVCRTLMVEDRIARAMKGGRLYGTSFACMVFGNGMDSHTPLDVDRIGPDYPLRAIHVFDRYSVQAWEPSRIADVSDPHFGEAQVYEVFPPASGTGMDVPKWRVHRTRMIRFDGRKPLTSFGWTGYYDREWGLSEVVAALVEITQDASLAKNIAHLTHEASISVVKMSGFRNAVSGEAAPEDVTPESYGMEFNRSKSNFGTIFMDKADEWQRVAVQFAGMPNLMDKFAARLAAMADIPETRFNGRSASGFNATGQHDMENYAVHVASNQARFQRESMDRLDLIVARAAGLEEPPEMEWPSLLEMQMKDRMEAVQQATTAILNALDRGVIDESYAAERLSQYDDVFGNVPEPPEPEPEPMPGPMPPGAADPDDPNAGPGGGGGRMPGNGNGGT